MAPARRLVSTSRRPLLQGIALTCIAAVISVVSFQLGVSRGSGTSPLARAGSFCAMPLNETKAATAANVAKPAAAKGVSAQFRLPSDTLAERSFVTVLDHAARLVASPSILKLPFGRLLVLYEQQAAWGVRAPETSTKLVYASDDGGASWQHVGSPKPLHWPSIFQCASGVYIIGVERFFSNDNNVVISRMLDAGGAQWSPATRISTGWSAVMANTGVDVSWGRVTKAFEIIPVKGKPVKESKITQRVEIKVSLEGERFSWRYPPLMNVTVEDSKGFVVNTLVKIRFEPHPLFFRILDADHSQNTLQLRLERFTMFWIKSDVVVEVGAVLTVGSGANIYGAVDWVAMAMSADETADLTDPKAWTYSEPLGNPASVRVQEVGALLDVAFRPDHAVRKSIIGFDHDFIAGGDTPAALEAGFGSLYWMEGVVVRLQDRRGASGKLLVILRINNDLACDLAALVAVDDTRLREAAAAAGAKHPGNGRRAAAMLRRQLLQDANKAEDGKAATTLAEEAADDAAAKEVAAIMAASSDRAGQSERAAAAQTASPEAVVGSGKQQEVSALQRRFLRYRNIPGLAIGHPAILYDNVTDLYWMASNMNRDSTRRWRQPWQKTLPKLHITPFSKCEVDRTTMGLYYSGNAMDWWPAGVVDYHLDFASHFTYPHMTVDEADLLVVMRASSPQLNVTDPKMWYNNHNSNALSFHRIRDFRRLANVQWATYEGEYTLRPRSLSSDS